MIKVTVIVPVYNNELYIRECLESIMNQTMKELEILVVNDGSTDGTLEIIQELAGTDSRIIIYDIQNSGYGKAVNLGISHARGEYIGIVESDDYIAPEMFEELYTVAKNNDLDIVKGDFYKFIGEGTGRSLEYISMCKEDLYGRIMCPACDREAFGGKIYIWAGIYKKEFLEKYNIRVHESPGASYQDNGFWFITFMYAKKVCFVHKAYYYLRRDNPNSSMMAKDKLECIFEEYRYIKNIMQGEAHSFKSIASVFWFYKYKTYMAHLDRIAEQYYQKFTLYFQDDFAHGFETANADLLFTEYDLENIKILLENTRDFVIYNKYSYKRFQQLFDQMDEVSVYVDGSIGMQMLKILVDGRSREKKIHIILGENVQTCDFEMLYKNMDIIPSDKVSENMKQNPVIVCTGRLRVMDCYMLLKEKDMRDIYIFSHRWLEKEDILFSVIVPIYNAEYTLEKCLDSIIGQTYKNLEILLVEDGCTDRSDEICRCYAQKDPRVSIIRKENGGVVSARKAGIMAATGMYVGYVDADDWLEKNTYEYVYNELRKADIDILAMGCMKEHDTYSERIDNLIRSGIYIGEHLETEVHTKMLYFGGMYRYGILQYIWNKVYKRKLLLTNQLKVDDEIVNGEDVACVYPCLLDAASVKVVNKYFYHYRIAQNTMTSMFYSDFPYHAGRLYHYLCQCFEEHRMREILIWQLNQFFVHFIRVGARKVSGIRLNGKNIINFGRIPYGAKIYLVTDEEKGGDVAEQLLLCPYCEVVAQAAFDSLRIEEICKKLDTNQVDLILLGVSKKNKNGVRNALESVGICDKYIFSAF